MAIEKKAQKHESHKSNLNKAYFSLISHLHTMWLKGIIMGAAAVLAASVFPFNVANTTCPEYAQFNEWATKYGKIYKDESERNVRCLLFRHNLQKVNRHNSLHTWQATINRPWSDRGKREYRRLRHGRGRLHVSEPYNRIHADAVYHGVPTNRKSCTAPAVDIWSEGLVASVKDQGQYGTCWAQAGSGVLEALYANANASLELVRFSAQQLSDCTGGIDSCNGGFTLDSLRYAQAAGGIAAEGDYPYVGCGECPSGPVPETVPLNISKILSVADELALQSALINNTVVAVAIDASGQGFGFYDHGIYDGIFDGSPDCCADAGCLDHEVLAVGYLIHGVGPATNKFPYYLIKNSWGTTWGKDGGYIMMRAGKNTCGVATDAVFAL